MEEMAFELGLEALVLRPLELVCVRKTRRNCSNARLLDLIPK